MNTHSPEYHEMSPDDLVDAYRTLLMDGEPAPLDLLVALEAHGLPTDIDGTLWPTPQYPYA